jgi:hypothetical protein
VGRNDNGGPGTLRNVRWELASRGFGIPGAGTLSRARWTVVVANIDP